MNKNANIRSASRRRLFRRSCAAFAIRNLLAAIALLAVLAAGAIAFLFWHRHFSTMTGKRAPDDNAGRPSFTVSPSEISGSRALEAANRLIAIGPRVSGTEGAEKAAIHLGAQLTALQISPSYDFFDENTVAGRITFHNISGTITGAGNPDEIILLISHFDTKDGISNDFVGANDSGSSSGLLLELARVLKAHEPLPISVMVAFLDGEECKKRYSVDDGLHGSCRLADKLQRTHNVRAVILLDMIGDRDLTVTIPRNTSPKLAGIVLAAARKEGVRDKFGLHEGSILDDHVPFLKAGMQVVNIIDFQYGSAPGKNDYWHTPHDTPDKLSAESLETVGRVVIRTLDTLMQY